MNLNDDVVYRRLRLGPLHQRHPGRSRSLIRHHNRLHQAPPCIQSSPLHRQMRGGAGSGLPVSAVSLLEPIIVAWPAVL